MATSPNRWLTPGLAARRVPGSAALGGLGGVFAAIVHDLASPAGYRPAMLTGVPAFVSAYVVAIVPRRFGVSAGPIGR